MFDLRQRTKDFALRITKLYTALPKSTEAQVLGKQILRSGTSVGAHYREATRARSTAEFISKIEGGLQELEETVYWLELLIEAEIFVQHRMKNLLGEAEELTAILVTMVKTAKKKQKPKTLIPPFILHTYSSSDSQSKISAADNGSVNQDRTGNKWLLLYNLMRESEDRVKTVSEAGSISHPS